MNPQPAPQGPPSQDQESGDPLTTLGGILSAMAQGMKGAPPEVQKGMQMMQQGYQMIVQAMGQGPAPAPGAAMSGGNPGAQPVK